VFVPDFIVVKDDKRGGDKWSYIRRAKFQSNRHYQQINTQLFYRLDVSLVTELRVSKR